MKSALKNIAERILPVRVRREIYKYKDKAVLGAYSLPVVGKTLWDQKITRLEQRPETIAIEVTSICNSKCIMCPRHLMDRKMEVMPYDLYKKVIKEAKELGVKSFALNGYGEIFTAKKDYQFYINHLLEEIPGAKIHINSNGSLLNESVAQFLIDKGVHSVHIDIDGATKETFEKVREKLKFDMVVKNVRRLVEMRKAQGKMFPIVLVGFIKQKENEHEERDHFEMWKDVADHTTSNYMVSRLGAVDKYLNEKFVDKPCALPWYEFNVWSDGHVVLCCDDWNAEEKMGNIRYNTIQEIWTSKKFREFRALQQNGRAGEISTCAKCDWARPGPVWFRTNRYSEEQSRTALQDYQGPRKREKSA